MPMYLGTESAGTDQFSLQDFEPSFKDKLDASTRESWLESYGPVTTDWLKTKIAGTGDEPKLSPDESAAAIKASGVKMHGQSPNAVYTQSQLDIILNRQRELTMAKDVRDRTPWDMGSAVRGAAMFGAGIVDPINVATTLIPWTKSLTILNGVRAAAMAGESFAVRSGARAVLGAADAGISTAALEPAFHSMRQTVGDDYSAMDSMANIAFGTAFGGGLHVLGGAAGDVFRARRGDASIVTPNPTGEPISPPAGAAMGAGTEVKIGDTREPAQFAVVEADTLNGTVNKADNQFRDRNRASYQAEIQARANALDPDLVLSTDNPLMDVGTPTVAADGRIVGGNGRSMFIDKAYEIGKGGEYRAGLESRLAELGIDPETVKGMKKPVLVRRLQREVDIKKAAMLSNEGGSTDMSALEQSKVDAERLGDARLKVGADGDLQSPENRGAIRQWVEAQPENKRNALMDEDGKLSAEGLRRLNNALIHKAYGDSPTLGRLVESMDVGSRNLATAIGRTAPVVAGARDAIKSGDLHPLDIAGDVQQAVEKYNQLRDKGTKVADFMAQGDAFGDGMTPESRLLLDFMDRNISAPRRIADVVNGFYEGLQNAGNPKQGDLLGGSAMPDKLALLEGAIRGAESSVDTAAETIARVAPETREAALRGAVAQSVEGRNVDVDAIVGMDEAVGTSTIEDVKAAADKSFEPESQASADFAASAAVEARVKVEGKKSWALDDANLALGDADTALADTLKAGDQAFQYSRDAVPSRGARLEEAPVKAEFITESLQKEFGGSTQAMLDSGKVTVVNTVADLPGGPHPADVKAVTVNRDKVYIVAENVSAAEARGLVLHEVGVHIGMEGMLGAETFGSVLKQLDEAIAGGAEWAQAARAAVPADTPAHLVREEQLAYLVQSAPHLPIVKRIIAAIRAWAFKNFTSVQGKMKLTEGDYQALAVSALHAVARDGDSAVGIGAALARKTEGGYASAVKEYAALSKGDFDTEGGRILNTDIARELSPAYRRDRTRSADVHEPASAFIKRLYADKLSKPTPDGMSPTVVFTAGGTGAGKSTGMRALGRAAGEAEIVYDTNMNTLGSAVQKIEQALDAGRSATILYTYRDPIEALTGGALPRAERMGRTVPLREHARTHSGSNEVIRALAEKYADNDKVQIVAIDNSKGRGKSEVVDVAKIPSIEHTELERKLYEAATAEREAGRISEKTYRGTVGEGQPQGMVGEGGAAGRRKSEPPDQSEVNLYARGETPDNSAASEELKPYDEKIARAKQFADVLRAAADKLGNDAAATEAMRAAMPDISAAEIKDLLDQLRQSVKGLRGVTRSTRDALGAEELATGIQYDAMQAADELANNMELAAVIAKRNAALNMNVRLKGASFVNQFRTAKLDVEGFRGLLVGTERKRAGGRISVDAEQKNFRGEWIGGLLADTDKAGVREAFVSGKFDRDAYTALWNMGRDGADNSKLAPEAVKIAEIINKYQSDARNTRNRFGAWIRDLQGYIVRQSHDMYKMRDAGEKAWIEHVLPRLDLVKMRKLGIIGDDVQASLRGMYDDFAAGNHMKPMAGEDDIAALGRGSNLARRESASRTLFFKDGGAAFEYNEKFGQGRLADAVLSGLDHSAKSAGLLKILGTNPEANLGRMFDEYAESLRADPVRRAKFLSSRKEVMTNLLGTVDGSMNIPGNVTGAKVGSFLRSWESMAKLGGALISSVTDLTNYAAEMRFSQNKNLLSGTLDGMNALVQGRAKGEKAAVLNSIGIFHESVLGSVFHRFDSPDLVGGKTAWAMQQFFKLNGLTWWTESLQDGAALQHSNYLASNAAHSFDKLPPALRDMLGLYNIDAGKWDVLRIASTMEADGRKYMTPEGLKTVPTAALENYIQQAGRTVSDAAILNLQDDLSSALRTMTIDRMHHAVIEPNARTRAFMLRGTQPGTVPGEFLRYIGQFKSFPAAMIQMVLGREIYGRGYDTLGDYIKNGKGDMVGLATFIGLSTMMGYAAMSVKDMIKGKNPRPIDDPRTWAASMVQGGGLGIYGDFLFNKYNRMGGTLSGSMAGPVVNLADTAADLWTRVRTGEDFGATSFNAALSNTPFMNLFYTRTALDYLILYRMQEAMNPGFLRRMERRAERENGQTFFLPPSQVAR
jgi:hypothetical protein